MTNWVITTSLIGIKDSRMNTPAEMRHRVYTHMIETRGWKYRVFLRYLRFFKYIAMAPKRGEFLESYYVLMRYLDDIVDGDLPIPAGYTTAIDYLQEKIAFSQNPVHPKDEADYLMLHCFQVAEKFGEEFSEETEDILNSLLFDANRRGKRLVFPKKELMHHFHVLDIRGTIRATLKIFKDDPKKYLLLEPLGMACRYQYDLEDIETDLAAGFINISQEECEQFQISSEDLENAASKKIQRWMRHRAKEGLLLLKEHHKNLPKGDFSLLEKWVFKLVYEAPARKVFKKTLEELKIPE